MIIRVYLIASIIPAPVQYGPPSRVGGQVRPDDNQDGTRRYGAPAGYFSSCQVDRDELIIFPSFLSVSPSCSSFRHDLPAQKPDNIDTRSEEHTSELQS